jgi:hypothetical protein
MHDLCNSKRRKVISKLAHRVYASSFLPHYTLMGFKPRPSVLAHHCAFCLENLPLCICSFKNNLTSNSILPQVQGLARIVGNEQGCQMVCFQTKYPNLGKI